MAPVPADPGAISSAADAVVGGSKPALSFPTILAFLAVLIAAIQGALVLESADPCRISYRKLLILVVLEVVEMFVMGASEVLSFVELKRALAVRLEWLQFLPPCILMIGILEIFLDVDYTYRGALRSRLYWVPFSASGRKRDGSKRQHWEIFLLIVTGVCSFVLIGWRQRWWWVSKGVSEEVAIRASEESRALSVGVMVFCVVWGLMTSGAAALFVVHDIITGVSNKWRYSFDMFFPIPFEAFRLGVVHDIIIAVSSKRRDFFAMFFPNRFKASRLGDRSLASSVPRVMERSPTNELRAQQRLVNKLCQAQLVDNDATMEDDKLNCQLKYAPLHIGNAVVGKDKKHVVTEDGGSMSLAHVFTLVVEHLSIMPLLFTVLVAVAQLRHSMGMETFNAMKQLVDVVVIVALVEIAIGVKSLVWSVSGNGNEEGGDEEADRVISDDPNWIQMVLQSE